MNRYQISNDLSRALGADFNVVPSPDHPELISAPDVIVGGRGRVTAMFRVARSTRPRMLEARVVAARLALPPGSSLVALVEDDAESRLELVRRGFDFVLRSSDTRHLARLCGAGPPERLPIETLREVQRKHAIVYSTLLQFAETRQRGKPKPSSAREVVAALRQRHGPGDVLLSTDMESKHESGAGRPRGRPFQHHSPRATVGNSTVAMLSERRRSITMMLTPVWTEAFADDYVLEDDGVPYPRDFHPRILLVETWPTHRSDPRKPARAAAFSSWLMAVPSSATQVAGLIERSESLISKRLNA